MQKKINWKNASLTLLAASNLLLIGNKATENNQSLLYENETETIEQLNERKNELMNELYNLEIELELYNEYPINEVEARNPNATRRN